MQLMGMYPNSMQNQGVRMMGSPMSVSGTGGFPMAVTGPMHHQGMGADSAGNWGMMCPGMPEDGAGFYGQGPPPGMVGGSMGMAPMSSGRGGQQGMDVQCNGSSMGRNAHMRNTTHEFPASFS